MSIGEVRVGDELIISCEPTDAMVEGVSNHYVFIKWPWGERDQSSRARWDGSVALPRSESNPEWANTPWRVEPPPRELKAGSSCMVGIPPSRVLVREVQEYDPPCDLGWLPRPTMGLSVVDARDEDAEDAGYLVHLDGAEPILFERVIG
jgi:hypothetical protein